MKWTGRIVGGLLGIVVLALAVLYGVTEYRMRKTYHVSPAPLAFHPTPDAVQKGARLAVVRGCTDCHGENLGGKQFIDEMPLGRLYASNLTSGRGGVGATYTDQDWVRSIRHGVGPDGKPLLFMPAHEFNPIGDEDLGVLLAYVKSLPPVENVPVDNAVGPLGRALFLAGELPLVPAEMIDHDAPRKAAPAPGATAEYGAYLATGCTGCHGEGFSGGKIPGTPPDWPAAANLTSDPETGIGKWTEQDFFRALREGKRPDGTDLKPQMPWKLTAQMTDEEIRATWLYLRTVPAKAHGNR